MHDPIHEEAKGDIVSVPVPQPEPDETLKFHKRSADAPSPAPMPDLATAPAVAEVPAVEAPAEADGIMGFVTQIFSNRGDSSKVSPFSA